MKVLNIPTFWTAAQADTIHEFLGELQAAVWQAYHEDIQRMYKDIRDDQTSTNVDRDFDDDIDF